MQQWLCVCAYPQYLRGRYGQTYMELHLKKKVGMKFYVNKYILFEKCISGTLRCGEDCIKPLQQSSLSRHPALTICIKLSLRDHRSADTNTAISALGSRGTAVSMSPLISVRNACLLTHALSKGNREICIANSLQS